LSLTACGTDRSTPVGPSAALLYLHQGESGCDCQDDRGLLPAVFPIATHLRFILFPLLALASVTVSGAQSLQGQIDATPAGGTLRLPAGLYAGPVVISKPVTVDGRGQATLDGGGTGTVITIRGAGTIVRGLHIVNSGDLHDQTDAAILIEGDGNVIENNVMVNVLFGVVLQQASGNVVRANRIRSRHRDPADRGDAVRLWYSFGNRIADNDIADARDAVAP